MDWAVGGVLFGVGRSGLLNGSLICVRRDARDGVLATDAYVFGVVGSGLGVGGILIGAGAV